jgi:hypothetical protein
VKLAVFVASYGLGSAADHDPLMAEGFSFLKETMFAVYSSGW